MASIGRTLLLLLPILCLCVATSFGACSQARRERKAAEVSDGPTASPSQTDGSCGCSSSPAPSPSTSEPNPDDFPNLKQYYAYLVIQRFKQTITCDPDGVTATWVGYRPCTYRGFYCETPPDSPETPTVASVDFNGFRLCAPTVAGFVDQLPDLALFHANSNNFSGPIPDLTGLRYLYELDVSNNIHSGPFPAAVLPLSNLVFLDLRYNLFAGTVPASIFFLDLDVLFLNNNNFNQQLPANLGSSPVAYLTLANNGFTGSLPRSIFNASRTLVEVLFLNNKLSGCLPYEIGTLSTATVFDVGSNQFTGPIPWSFGCLLQVEQLNLAGNLLYGEVPDVVCRLAKDGNLANLSLSGNYFTSVGHSCWELIKRKVLDVRQNCIPWFPEQRRPVECWRFLWHRKFCPLFHYIPCSLPKCAPKPAAPPPPGYMTYKALHQPPRN
ncbi:leucine Rich Repeat [Musa troglodytarum]|uniref:Leucine Rich Repeat n=1 Tax=Musa troglodytarum TaxID=320322 RepID=A0A9E7EIW5_9LILI|nr:leucine Rich Repeat [Musa troglodytarum]